MANNYTEGSCMLVIPEDKREQAQVILDREIKDLEETGDEYCGCLADLDGNGVWFRSDESMTPEHVAIIARALIEELEIDEPFICSWAHTCSKLRQDEFGGGAFAMRRGHDTYWIDAAQAAWNHIRNIQQGETDDNGNKID